MQLVDVAGRRSQRGLDLLDRAEVEELAQLLDAHQLAEQVAVERERLRSSLFGRRVVLVHVGRDVLEEEGRGERGRRHGLDLGHRERARLDAAQDAAERGQVEDVLEHLAVRLEHDRELRVAARDLEEALRLQPLLPERRALTRSASRDEQCPRGVLAEARAVERRLRELAEQELLDLVRLEQEVGDRRRHVCIGEVQGDPVVRPQRLDIEVERVAKTRAQGHRPRRVHAAPERRENADPPVADLVAEALDDDRAVGGNDAGRGLLLAEIRDEVPGGERIEPVRALDALDRSVVGECGELARGLADPLPELRRAPDPFALPERSGAGDSRCR